MRRTLKKRFYTAYLLNRLINFLSKKRKSQVLLVIILMILSAGFELITLASVVPFLTLITDPYKIYQLSLFKELSGLEYFSDPSNLVIPLSIIFGGLALLSALIRTFNIWCSTKLSASIGLDISLESYKRTLSRPYKIHLESNTSEVIATTFYHCDQTIIFLSSSFQLLVSLFIAIALIIGLLLIDLSTALIITTLFAICYLSISFFIRKRLSRISQQMALSSKMHIKKIQEGLGSIRDLILNNSQNYYLNLYKKSDYILRNQQANSQFLSLFPRYSMEGLGLAVISVISLIVLKSPSRELSAITLLGAYALGAQKLLPAIQQIYSNYTSMQTNTASVRIVLDSLEQKIIAEKSYKNLETIRLKESIKLENVSFGYGDNDKLVLDSINLEFFFGDRIAIVGETGSGKSTLFDILMGLLIPTNGKIIIDSRDLNSFQYPNYLKSWQSKISHVPQDVFLSDNSFMENIAFGLPKKEIDLQKVIKAADQAKIKNFIDSQPFGFDTNVGERGIKLSGGQKQRIAIARALYSNTKVLFLDEATSSLDTGTENSIINSIESLDKDITIFMIAHRLNTITNFDRIIELRQGKVL